MEKHINNEYRYQVVALEGTGRKLPQNKIFELKTSHELSLGETMLLDINHVNGWYKVVALEAGKNGQTNIVFEKFEPKPYDTVELDENVIQSTEKQGEKKWNKGQPIFLILILSVFFVITVYNLVMEFKNDPGKDLPEAETKEFVRKKEPDVIIRGDWEGESAQKQADNALKQKEIIKKRRTNPNQ